MTDRSNDVFWANIIEKMQSSDKDFRFMALNDAMNELQQRPCASMLEDKFIKNILHMFSDTYSDVQTLAVRCLSVLVNTLAESCLRVVLSQLVQRLTITKDSMNEIAALALKSIISETASKPSHAAIVSSLFVEKYTSKDFAALNDPKMAPEVLDVLIATLSKGGAHVQRFHKGLASTLVGQLKCPLPVVKRKAISALASLVPYMPKSAVSRVVEDIFLEFSQTTDVSALSVFTQCMASIGRQVGHHLGDLMPTLIPALLANIDRDDEELAEHALQALEVFTLKCSTIEFSKQIVEKSMERVAYDPVYCYDGEDVDMGENDDEFDYSDDEDLSWKVRRAAIRCLSAVISSHAELLVGHSQMILPFITGRLKEHNVEVLSDLLSLCTVIFKQVHLLGPGDRKSRSLSVVESSWPVLATLLHKFTKSKHVKVIMASYVLMNTIEDCLPGSCSRYADLVVPGILSNLRDPSNALNLRLKIAQMTYSIFLHLNCHSADMTVHFPSIVEVLCLVLADNHRSLSVQVFQVIKLLAPCFSEPGFNQELARALSELIYSSVFPLFKSVNSSEDVRNGAIACMCTLMSHLHCYIPTMLGEVCPVMITHLTNQTTCITVMESLTQLSCLSSEPTVQLMVVQAVPVITPNLRRTCRELRVTSLICIRKMVAEYGSLIERRALDQVVAETLPLLSIHESLIARLALEVITVIQQVSPSVIMSQVDTVTGEIMKIFSLPYIQDEVVTSLAGYFTLLSKMLGSPMVLDLLFRTAARGRDEHARQFYCSLARCATSVVQANDGIKSIIETVTNSVQNQTTAEPVVIYYILLLGNLGVDRHVSSITSFKFLLYSLLSSESDEVKAAAWMALGRICYGDVLNGLDFLQERIASDEHHRPLLLSSLQEVLMFIKNYPDLIRECQRKLLSVWEKLLCFAESTEEGTRSILATCLSSVILSDPAYYLPELLDRIVSVPPLGRVTLLLAFRSITSVQNPGLDPHIADHLPHLLVYLNDADLRVRKMTLLIVHSTAHNRSSVIRCLLPDILPSIYEEIKVKNHLVHVVEMGPFKHTVDEGLDNRKAAFECMQQLVDHCGDGVNAFELLGHAVEGLKDQHDIKMLAFLLVGHLTEVFPTAVLQYLDPIADSLKKALFQKVKAGSVKLEYEKQEELQTAALVLLSSLLSLEGGAEKSPALAELVAQVNSNPETMLQLSALQKRGTFGVGNSTIMLSMGPGSS